MDDLKVLTREQVETFNRLCAKLLDVRMDGPDRIVLTGDAVVSGQRIDVFADGSSRRVIEVP